MFVLSIKINSSDLENFIQFAFKNEKILKEFGEIKITLNSQCQLALKKRQISCIYSTTQIITKINTFSIHSIPKQSLLQLGGNKVLDHIVSSLTRSNGSDGIYPLSN
ncbi:unnamed protein product, partial [Adineta steineri]